MRPWISSLAFATTLLSIGCASMNGTEKGAVGGGLLGGTAGAIIGSATGNTGAGAAIGAGLGAVAGGVTGNAIEESENRTKAAIAQSQQGRQAPLGLTDVASLAQSQVSEAVIIGQIRSSGSVFRLSASDIQWLKSAGVTDGVIIEMQQTASRPQPHYYQRPYRPVYVVEEPVFVAPPPPPIGVGVTYIHRR